VLTGDGVTTSSVLIRFTFALIPVQGGTKGASSDWRPAAAA
jgi:hypothetical protein